MTVSAIIPAYNEEKTIGSIIKILKSVEAVNEIIVVSDGSTDSTAATARDNGARVLEFKQNMGKGAAIKAGLENCIGEVVLFLDADLIGLKYGHVQKLIDPVLKGRSDMTIGVFTSGRFSTNFSHKVSPHLSGQRAIRKTTSDNIKNMAITGYGLEITLNAYARKENLKVNEIELEGVTHVMKEEKFGLLKGFGHRLKMYWQIYKGVRLAKR